MKRQIQSHIFDAILESYFKKNKLTSSLFVLNLEIIKDIYFENGLDRRTASSFDNFAFHIQNLYEFLNSDETIKLKNPISGEIEDKSKSDFYREELKKLENEVNNQIEKIKIKAKGSFFYDSSHLIKLLFSQDDRPYHDEILPFPIYISATGDDYDEVGIMIGENGTYSMFEENEESSPETDIIVKNILGISGEWKKVYGSHGEQVVFEVKKSKTLPENLYISPSKNYAKTYWSTEEQRVLFVCEVNMDDIKMESDVDWRTIRPANVKNFSILGNV